MPKIPNEIFYFLETSQALKILLNDFIRNTFRSECFHMESVYFIKGRKLFGGVCGSSLNQTPFQMSHLIQGEIESGPRSSLVFKQPATISSQPVTTFESKHSSCI